MLYRLLRIVPVALVVSTAVFFLFKAIPGDPAMQIAGPSATQPELEAVRAGLGLNRPVWQQYLAYLAGLAQGNLGYSTIYRGNPLPAILERVPATLALTAAAIALTVLVGIPAGAVAATRHNRAVDHLVTASVTALLAMPNFWLGMLLVSALSTELGWLPSYGFAGPLSLILPALALASRLIGLVARMTRASVLEELRRDYVRTALAKGLDRGTVLRRHVLRNALIPTVTVIGLQAGYLLGGSVVVERLFAWPGVGDLLINAIAARDYALVQAVTLLFVVGFLLVNLVVDLAYAAINPRLAHA